MIWELDHCLTISDRNIYKLKWNVEVDYLLLLQKLGVEIIRVKMNAYILE